MVAFSFFWAACFVAPWAQRAAHTQKCDASNSVLRLSLPLASSPVLDEDLRVTIREGIAELDEKGSTNEVSMDLSAWQDSVSLVANLLSESEEAAERVLAEATRWLAWARAGKLARKYIRPDTVQPAQIQASIEWLRSGPLALSTEQVVDAVRQYPHLYLLNPAEAYRKVLGVAPRQYRDVDVLRNMLLEDPSILQFQYNCDNDCISECGSCWVTLQNRI